MGPVKADAVAHLAAQQLVTGDAQRFGLGVEQGVFDRSQAFADNASRRGPGGTEQVRVDALVIGDRLADDPLGEPFDDGRDTG